MNEELDVAPEATVIVDGENYFWWFLQNGKGPNVARRVLKRITKGFVRSENSALYAPRSWRPHKSHRHDMWRYVREISYSLPIHWCRDGFQSVDQEIISQIDNVTAPTLFCFTGDKDFEPKLRKLRDSGSRVIMVSARHIINHTYYNNDYEIVHYDDLVTS